MNILDKDRIMEDLKTLRQCADAECPDHDCKHCKLALDQDELVAVLDIVTAGMNAMLEQRIACPLQGFSPCLKNCAWYDGVNETCIAKRREKK